MEFDYIGDLAGRLHPDSLELVIEAVREEAAQTRVYKLVLPEGSARQELPYFRAGQYLSVRDDLAGVSVTRPYSICSSPEDAFKEGYYEIAVKKKEGGFFSEHVFAHWQVGKRLKCTGPHGFFYIDSLRDRPEIVALAGGSGITPFRSMIRDIVQLNKELRFTLLYGIRKPGEAIFAPGVAGGN